MSTLAIGIIVGVFSLLANLLIAAVNAAVYNRIAKLEDKVTELLVDHGARIQILEIAKQDYDERYLKHVRGKYNG